MEFFDDQAAKRRQIDDDSFRAAQACLESAVSGRRRYVFDPAWSEPRRAVMALLYDQGIEGVDFPRKTQTLQDHLDYLMDHGEIGYHRITLSKDFFRQAQAPMIARDRQGRYFALTPGFRRLNWIDLDTGRLHKLTRGQAEAMEEEACELFRPLPAGTVTSRDALAWLLGGVGRKRGAAVLGLAALIGLLGAGLPLANKALFSLYLPSGAGALALGVCALLLGLTLTQTALFYLQKALLGDTTVRLAYQWRAALMRRLLNLPASFFRRYSSSAALTKIAQGEDLPQNLIDGALSVTLAGSSLLCLVPFLFFSPPMGLAALGVTLCTLLLALLSFRARVKMTKRIQERKLTDDQRLAALLRAVAKIKMSGAQKRAFDYWSRSFALSLRARYQEHRFARLGYTPSRAMLIVGAAAAFFAALRGGADAGSFMAYQAAMGVLAASVSALLAGAEKMELAASYLALAEPVLSQPTECGDLPNPAPISGEITLENVHFRYSPEEPWVLEGVNLHIRAREYVALTGRSECGKSTLIRLLLGFGTPKTGLIRYGGNQLGKVNSRALRRQLGVVMQNGTLFPGSIFNNIAVSNPGLTLEGAWEAARIAHIDEEIRQMPMGMETLIQETGGVSGGQKQRLLIARAIAGKPRVLLMDEATSALDNVTQKEVVDGLAALRCTRVVVAHRLTTVAACDRIIVLDKGKIVEEGTYDQLLQRGGCFTKIAASQRLDLV